MKNITIPFIYIASVERGIKRREIVRETEKMIYSNNGYRYRKSREGCMGVLIDTRVFFSSEKASDWRIKQASSSLKKANENYERVIKEELYPND